MHANAIKYNALQAMGLQVWAPRSVIVQPDRLQINARCAVILFSHSEAPLSLQPAMQKILDGMLSVLLLPPQDIMLVTIIGTSPDLTTVSNTINSWQPQTVLQLDKQFAILQLDTTVIHSYSPQYLLENTEYKAQAYKDLLTLRNILHHGTS